MRLDLLLVRLRLAKSRSIAQNWVRQGHMRLNSARVEKPDTAIAAGHVLTLPMPPGVRVIVIETLPHRRGPPAEARACYHELDAGERVT